MTVLIVVGTQWGDEGKGKIVDLLTEQADAVVRYQGGNNAGHTVMFGDQTHILHLIPSGILRKTMSILGNGVVIDLPDLLKEIEELKNNGLEVKGTLHVSARSHLVMPWHCLFDQLRALTWSVPLTSKPLFFSSSISLSRSGRSMTTPLPRIDIVFLNIPEGMR
jgi:adenylosuccinate synthase